MNDIFYDAFISYSTQDSDFVTALRLALEISGRQVWQDVKELELSAEWWEQIRAGILASDNFLFVVSPSSMSSPVCHLELEYARELNKRLIIVRHQNAQKDQSTLAMVDRILKQPYLKIMTGGRDMLRLADQNWDSVEAEQNISIRNKDELSSQVPYLVSAFDKDLLYIRQGNILLGRAKEWLDSNNNPSFLLVGSALYAAEEWKDSGKQPEPTPKHLKYITASRDTVNRQRRRLVASTIVGVVAIILAIVASIFSLQTQQKADLIAAQIVQAEAQLTSFPATLTPIGSTLQASQIQITAIPPTLTQAAIIAENALILQGIGEAFSNSLIALNENRANPALDHLHQVIERHPDHGTSYLYRGIVYSLLEQEDEALNDFNEAIRLDPTLSRAYNNRGNIYYTQGEYEKAIEDYTHSIEIAPLDTVALVNRGLAYNDLGQYEQALSDYDLAIDIDPDAANAYHNRGLTYSDLEDYQNAITNYNEAIRLDARYTNAFNNRGFAHYKLGNYDLAIEDYNRAILLNPSYDMAFFNRANVYYYIDNYDLAIEDYTMAIDLNPENPAMIFNRGVSYYLRAFDDHTTFVDQEGDLLRALDDWRESDRLGYPISEAIREIMQEIESSLAG